MGTYVVYKSRCFQSEGGCMLYCVDYKLRDWKPEGKKVWDVIKIPENRSVFLLSQTYRQIGVYEFHSSSVSEYKNHQPIPFPIHTPLEFPPYCGFSTIAFRYMIKNK